MASERSERATRAERGEGAPALRQAQGVVSLSNHERLAASTTRSFILRQAQDERLTLPRTPYSLRLTPYPSSPSKKNHTAVRLCAARTIAVWPGRTSTGFGNR